MENHAIDGIPVKLLGYPIKSQTRIYISWVIPTCLELLVYLFQITADIALTTQHFRSGQIVFGWLTLTFLCAPAITTFLLIVTSSEQRNDPRNLNTIQFILQQLVYLFIFPIYVVYKFSLRIFWSVEALFRDNNVEEQQMCLCKATETSTAELYNFIQAYLQSAPQIMLQLYHMLREDLFRNYETTNVQAITLVFSSIHLATVTMSYQRFESQKMAGRHYPWSSFSQIQKFKMKKDLSKQCMEELKKNKTDSVKLIANFPENDEIFNKFILRNSGNQNEGKGEQNGTETKEMLITPGVYDVTDGNYNENIDVIKVTSDENKDKIENITDDDKMRTHTVISPKNHMEDIDAIEVLSEISDESEILDAAPRMRAPSAPTSPTTPPVYRFSSNQTDTAKLASSAYNRLSTFKDMLILNTELYIKEKIPRPPKMLIQHALDAEQQKTTNSAADEVDFFIPKKHKIINGVEQDDFAGKCVAFCGWVAFIIMRMLALSTFSVFYLKELLYILIGHYLLMLVFIYLETRFRTKLNRIFFYFFLAYAFIFVILEFKIRFKKIRLWYISIFIIMMVENLTMTFIWYNGAEFESWWFDFMYNCIIYSGILFILSLVVYYWILRPKDVVLYEYE